MNEFVRKFYWLVVTSACSVFVFLCTEIWNTGTDLDPISPFEGQVVDSSSISNLQSRARKRRNRIQELEKVFLTKKTISDTDIRGCLAESLKNDRIVKGDIGLIEVVTQTLSQQQGGERDLRLRALQFQKEILTDELLVWETLADQSVLYLNDPSGFDKIRFIVDFGRRQNSLLARLSRGSEELRIMRDFMMPTDTFNFVMQLVKIAILAALASGLGWVIVTFLLPVGAAIWAENKPNAKES